MTQSKNRLGVAARLVALGLLIAIGLAIVGMPATAVTLQTHNGSVISGVLGEVEDDVVILYRPQAYTVDLDQVAKIIPYAVDDSARLAIQAHRMRDLNRLIDHKTGAYQPFKKRVRNLLTQRDYDALEALAVEAWETAERTASGEWLLNSYYPAFSDDLGKRDVPAHERRRTQIAKWQTARPQSAHALTALLRITLDVSWAHRGNSYNSKVALKDRAATDALRAEARELAKQLVRSDDLDSAMLYQLTRVSSSFVPEHKDDALSVLALAARMAKVGPDYYHSFLGLVRKALPRWGGSVEEMDLLLQAVTTDLPPERRAETYFRMANWVLLSYGSREYVKFNFDWNSIQSGFEEMSARWPDLDLHRHQFAALAYLHGQPQAARKQLGEVHPGWNYIAESVWSHPDAMAEVQQWSVNKSFATTGSSTPPGLIVGLRAVGQGDLPALVLYLYKGGDVDARDETGRSLLQHSVKSGHPALVYSLISAGADVELTNSNGWQAVHFAAGSSSAVILEMLERAGANMEARTNKGNTLLTLAANGSNRRSLGWLLKRLPHTVNQAGPKGYTPLMHVAYDGHKDMVAQLLAVDGIDVNVQNTAGNTALHQAARRGNEGIVRLLLAVGADARVLNRRNNSVLALAEKSGNTSLVNLLQQQGLVLVTGASDESFKRSNKFITAANVLYTDGKMVEAAAMYQQAVDTYPESKVAHEMLATALWMNKETDRALRSIKTAIRIDPEDAELYYKAGRIAFSTGDRELYMPLFARYAKMAPNTYNAKDLLERLPELAEI